MKFPSYSALHVKSVYVSEMKCDLMVHFSKGAILDFQTQTSKLGYFYLRLLRSYHGFVGNLYSKVLYANLLSHEIHVSSMQLHGAFDMSVSPSCSVYIL